MCHVGNLQVFLKGNFQPTNNSDNVDQCEISSSLHEREPYSKSSDITVLCPQRQNPDISVGDRPEVSTSSWATPTKEFYESSDASDVDTGKGFAEQALLQRIREHAQREDFSSEELEEISAGWARGGLGEHASVASFARLTLGTSLEKANFVSDLKPGGRERDKSAMSYIHRACLCMCVGGQV